MYRKVIYIFVGLVAIGEGKPTVDTIDQSQTGDLNVEVSLKNVQIIAVLTGKEQYTDYDYNYDYTEMTIKPPNKTSTATPLNATATANATATEAAHLETTTRLVEITPKDPPGFTQESSDSTIHSLNEETASSSTQAVETPARTMVTSTMAPVKETPNSGVTAAVNPEPEECRKGFHRNKKGECELKLKPSSTNALLKLVELSQKLKLRRAN